MERKARKPDPKPTQKSRSQLGLGKISVHNGLKALTRCSRGFHSIVWEGTHLSGKSTCELVMCSQDSHLRYRSGIPGHWKENLNLSARLLEKSLIWSHGVFFIQTQRRPNSGANCCHYQNRDYVRRCGSSCPPKWCPVQTLNGKITHPSSFAWEEGLRSGRWVCRNVIRDRCCQDYTRSRSQRLHRRPET